MRGYDGLATNRLGGSFTGRMFVVDLAWLQSTRGLPIAAQAAACGAWLRRPVADMRLARAKDEAFRRMTEMPSPLPDLDALLIERKLNVVHADQAPEFGFTTLRAFYSDDTRTITLYTRALHEVQAAAASLGFSLDAPARDVVLAHEAFHGIAPECPEDVAEIAANLFATQFLGLSWYAGLLDPLTLIHRRATK